MLCLFGNTQETIFHSPRCFKSHNRAIFGHRWIPLNIWNVDCHTLHQISNWGFISMNAHLRSNVILFTGLGEPLWSDADKQEHMELVTNYSIWRMRSPAKLKCELCVHVCAQNIGRGYSASRAKRTLIATQTTFKQCLIINFTPGLQCCYITNINSTSPALFRPSSLMLQCTDAIVT